MTKSNQSINWMDSIGIGMFLFFTILQFSSLSEQVLRHLFIALEIKSKIIFWLPELLGLLVIAVISVFALNKMNAIPNIVSRKTLKNILVIYFVTAVMQTCYSIYGSEYLYNVFTQEFETYYAAVSENYLFQGFMGLIGLLKYVVFGVVLYLKREDVVLEDQKPEGQISEIGKL